MVKKAERDFSAIKVVLYLYIIEQKRGLKLVSKEKGGGLRIPKRLVS
jgi:hypothetical protein